MPAHVLRKAVVGVEFIASAVTSAIESQQVELIPIASKRCQCMSGSEHRDEGDT